MDVACGTGRHIEYLRDDFDVEGVDISQEFLDIARQRNPGISFHHADMTDFDLGREFDVVVSLFSAIGYVKTLDNLVRAVNCMAQHVTTGGILVIEPWFVPDAWHPGSVHATFVDEPELKIARINTSSVEGRLSIIDFHYLIGTPEGIEHLSERRELGLFETDEMCAAFVEAGLDVTYDAEGLMGRGLFVGRRSG